MAKILYMPGTGRILGVTSDQDADSVQMPLGAAWLAVQGEPSDIRWPLTRAGEPGSEHTSMIDSRGFILNNELEGLDVAEVRDKLAREFEQEGLKRIQAMVGEIEDEATLRAVFAVLRLLPNGVGSLDMDRVRALHQFARVRARAKLAALHTKAELQQVIPSSTFPFNDGEGWE